MEHPKTTPVCLSLGFGLIRKKIPAQFAIPVIAFL